MVVDVFLSIKTGRKTFENGAWWSVPALKTWETEAEGL